MYLNFTCNLNSNLKVQNTFKISGKCLVHSNGTFRVPKFNFPKDINNLHCCTDMYFDFSLVLWKRMLKKEYVEQPVEPV